MDQRYIRETTWIGVHMEQAKNCEINVKSAHKAQNG